MDLAQLEKVFHFVRLLPTNKISLNELKKKSICEGNIETLLQSEYASALLWIRKFTPTHWEIRAKIDIELCLYYIQKKCCNGSCGKLHLCKQYLASANSCSEPCPFNYSHSLKNTHNEKILKSYNISENEIELLRASFPRLCEFYVSFGKCSLFECNALHLCPDYVRRKCGQVCQLTAQFGIKKEYGHALKNQYNRNILNLFNLTETKLNPLLANVLIDDSVSKLSEKELKESKTLEQKDSQSRSKHENENANTAKRSSLAISIPGICDKYIEGKCNEKDCTNLHICKEYFIQKSRCNQMQCKYGLSHDLYSKHNKVLLPAGNHDTKTINFNDLQNKYIRICKNIGKDGDCNSKLFCNQLHICPRYLYQECPDDQNCYYPHNLQSSHNQNVCKALKIEPALMLQCSEILQYILVTKNVIHENFSLKSQPKRARESSLKSVTNEKSVRKKTGNDGNEKITINNQMIFPPGLCKYYLVGKKCNKNDDCTRLHICKDFLMGVKTCSSNECMHGYSHDLFNANNRKIIGQHFNKGVSRDDILNKLKKSYPKICLKYGNEKDCKNKKCLHLHICPKFALDKCNNENCQLSHNYETLHNEYVFETFNLSLLLKHHQKSSIPSNIFSSLKDFIIKDCNPPVEVAKEHQKIENSSIITDLDDSSTNLITDADEEGLANCNKQLITNNEIIVTPEAPKREYVEDAPNISFDNVLKFILDKDPFSGICPIKNQELLEQFFNNSLNHAKSWFRRNRNYFRLVCNSANEIFIHICIIDMEPCQQYWRKNGCSKKDCNRFHICRKYLFEAHDSSRCKLNHDLQSNNFKRLQLKFNVSPFSDDQILTILRKRYPSVCTDYQTGVCLENESHCDDLHICKNFILDKCVKDESFCELQHESGLIGKQAQKLAKSFNLPLKILRSTLLVKPNSFQMENAWSFKGEAEGSTKDFKTDSESSSNLEEDAMTKDELEITAEASKEENIDDTPNVSLYGVLNLILNKDPFGGICSIENEELLQQFFNNSLNHAKSWFRRNKNYFRLVLNSTDEIFIHICIIDVEPCQQYWRKNGCNKKDCSRFHVCRRYLVESHDSNRCKLNHNLHSDDFIRLLLRFNISHFSDDQVLTILRKRYPSVCTGYQTGACSESESYCDDLHVCKNFILDKCVKDEFLCELQHESGLTGKQAQKLAKSFNLPLKILRSALLIKPNSYVKENICSPKGGSVKDFHSDSETSTNLEKDSMTKDEFKITAEEKIEQKKFLPEKRIFVVKEAVISFILEKDPKGGRCPLDHPELLQKFFDNSIEVAEKWFNQHKSNFYIVLTSSKKFIHICMVDVEPCQQLWRKNGCSRSKCGKFHVCRKLLFQPHNSFGCRYNHDVFNEDCKELLEYIKLAHLSSDQILTILRKRYPIVCMKYQDSICGNTETNCDALHICKDFVLGKCSKEDCSCILGHESSLNGPHAKYISSLFNLPLRNLKSSLLVPPSNFEIIEDVWVEDNNKKDIDNSIDKREIIRFIMNENPSEGKLLVSNPNLLAYFYGSDKSAEDWFRKNHSLFRLSSDNNGEKSVHVCIIDVEPCRIHWSSNGCFYRSCGRFHVCKKLLFEKHNANTCSFNHDFDDGNCQRLIEKNRLQDLSDDQLIAILKNRLPFVCENYQTGKCMLGENFCESLHVCKDFLSNDCKGCSSLIHGNAFASPQAKRICSNYSVQEVDLKNVILYQENVKMVTESKEFNALKDEGICLDYLNSNCVTYSQCPKVHIKTPYLWQYKQIDVDKWKNCRNEMVERYFCSPSSSEIGVSMVGLSCRVDVDISNQGCFKSFSSPPTILFRRLSTRSSVLITPDNFVGTTEWKWYWEESKSKWTEYSKGTDSYHIEKSFLSGDSYHEFTTDEFTYRILFDEMVQQNCDERYFTRRRIRRRPVFQDKLTKPSFTNKSGIQYPSTWPTKCTPGHLINVTGRTRNKLERDFIKSISRTVTVLEIKEVCNHEFYEKYEIKKNQIKKKSTEIGEKFLYHGTSYDTVKNICAQNFDFRMSGKNATAFGKGSYFSTSASYSHNYSSSNLQDIYFMFIGQVITGKYTQGNSSYTRPPPLHSGSFELYDSCVDSVHNPSMYIIFDRDQCYPRYLISYRIGSSSSNNFLSNPSSSTYQSYQQGSFISNQNASAAFNSSSSSGYGQSISSSYRHSPSVSSLSNSSGMARSSSVLSNQPSTTYRNSSSSSYMYSQSNSPSAGYGQSKGFATRSQASGKSSSQDEKKGCILS